MPKQMSSPFEMAVSTWYALTMYLCEYRLILRQIDIFEQTPEVKAHFIRSHGLLTIIESLQGLRSREVIGLELRIINLIIADDPDSLEKLCVGLICR